MAMLRTSPRMRLATNPSMTTSDAAARLLKEVDTARCLSALGRADSADPAPNTAELARSGHDHLVRQVLEPVVERRQVGRAAQASPKGQEQQLVGEPGILR